VPRFFVFVWSFHTSDPPTFALLRDWPNSPLSYGCVFRGDFLLRPLPSTLVWGAPTFPNFSYKHGHPTLYVFFPFLYCPWTVKHSSQQPIYKPLISGALPHLARSPANWSFLSSSRRNPLTPWPAGFPLRVFFRPETLKFAPVSLASDLAFFSLGSSPLAHFDTCFFPF